MSTKQTQSLAEILKKLLKKAEEVHFSAEHCLSDHSAKQHVEDDVKLGTYFKLFLEVLLKENLENGLVARDVFLRFLLNCPGDCLNLFAEYVRVETETAKDQRIQCFSRKNFGEIFGEYYGAKAFGRLPLDLISMEKAVY